MPWYQDISMYVRAERSMICNPCLWSEHVYALTLMLVVASLSNTKWCKILKSNWNPGIWVLNTTHLRVLIKSYLMNTNITGFRWCSKVFCVLVLWTKVASALEGLIVKGLKPCLSIQIACIITRQINLARIKPQPLSTGWMADSQNILSSKTSVTSPDKTHSCLQFNFKDNGRTVNTTEAYYKNRSLHLNINWIKKGNLHIYTSAMWRKMVC